MRKTRSLLILHFLCAALAWSQTDRGSIRGTIFDATRAVVPNAKVTATNVATGVASATDSTDAGAYNISALPSGTYRVEVRQAGFKKLLRDNIVVAAASVIGVDLTLEIGEATEVVRVTAASPILQTETSATSTEVNAKAYADLPLSSGGGGRRSAGFLLLVPGYSGTPGGMSDTVNGAQLNSKDAQIDGVSNVTGEITGDGRNIRFPPDVVQELSVATTAYAPEYGNSGGGVERYVLKSGTNEVHGNAYEFFRNTVLDAHGFFNRVRPIHKENEYGFTAGAPIVIPSIYNGKNRSFLYFGVNWYKFRNASSTTITSLPNDAFRAGDLSGLTQKIYDPASTRQLPDNTYTRDLFPGNIIPAGRMSSVSKNVLSYVPRSTTQSTYNNYYAQIPVQWNNLRTITIKGDHYFSGKHHLTVSDVYTDNPYINVGPLPAPIQNASGPLNSYAYNFGRTTHDWTITPRILNQFRLGFNRQSQNTDSPERANGWPRKLGMAGLGLASGIFPAISWGSFNTLAGSQTFNYPVSNTYLISDALSWTAGRHNLKFGGEYRILNTYLRREQSVNVSFSRNETAFPATASLSSTGLEYASFLLGQADSASVPLYGPFAPHYVTSQFAVYAQDDFKITPRLTINYGLRFDRYTPIRETHNYYAVMDPTVPNPAAGNLPGAFVFAGLNGQGSRLSFAKNASPNFAPRIGLAWRLRDKFVVRAGYGISYFQTGAYGGGNNTAMTDGFWITSTAQSLNSGITPAYNWDEGFPQANLIVPPKLDAGLNVGSGRVYSWDTSAGRAAYSQNWNFSTQTQLASSLTLEVGYVGSKGTRLPARTDTNQLDPKYYSLGSTLNNNVGSAAVVAAGYKAPYPGFTGSLAQALRPFPQYVYIFAGSRSSTTIGNSTYHSLQVKLDKRFSKGLSALAAYTWSKALTDAAQNFVQNASISRNLYNRALDKTMASYDRPHTLAVAFNYELPIGPGKPLLNRGGVAAKIFGGWQLNGILTYRSGAPISVSAAQTLPLAAVAGLTAIPQTADTVAGAAELASWNGRFDPAANVYLNLSAFAAPGAYRFGTSSLYLPWIRTFPYFNEDLGLVKKTRIGERVAFEIRLEAFNAFNRTIFGTPTSNVSVPQTFGKITGVANSARNGQLAAKISF